MTKPLAQGQFGIAMQKTREQTSELITEDELVAHLRILEVHIYI